MSSSNLIRVVIASPHKRNDRIGKVLESEVNLEVLFIHDKSELTNVVLSNFNPQYIFFPHWPWYIQSEIFDNYECIIFHMTDLPFGRGGSPLQNLIVRGFDETKLSAIRCVEELDAGPVYIQRPLSLAGTAEEILIHASELVVDMIIEIIEKQPNPKQQVGQSTIFKRRKQEDGDLSQLDNLKSVYDYIRMLDADGYPDSFVETDNLKFEFCKASNNANTVTATVKISLKGSK